MTYAETAERLRMLDKVILSKMPKTLGSLLLNQAGLRILSNHGTASVQPVVLRPDNSLLTLGSSNLSGNEILVGLQGGATAGKGFDDREFGSVAAIGARNLNKLLGINDINGWRLATDLNAIDHRVVGEGGFVRFLLHPSDAPTITTPDDYLKEFPPMPVMKILR